MTGGPTFGETKTPSALSLTAYLDGVRVRNRFEIRELHFWPYKLNHPTSRPFMQRAAWQAHAAARSTARSPAMSVAGRNKNLTTKFDPRASEAYPRFRRSSRRAAAVSRHVGSRRAKRAPISDWPARFVACSREPMNGADQNDSPHPARALHGIVALLAVNKMDLSERFQMRLGVHSIVSLKLLHLHLLPLRATY
jgi:hypothetical protein